MELLEEHLSTDRLAKLNVYNSEYHIFEYDPSHILTNNYYTHDETRVDLNIHDSIYITYGKHFILWICKSCAVGFTFTYYIDQKSYHVDGGTYDLQTIIVKILKRITLTQQEDMYRSMLETNNTKNARKA